MKPRGERYTYTEEKKKKREREREREKKESDEKAQRSIGTPDAGARERREKEGERICTFEKKGN